MTEVAKTYGDALYDLAAEERLSEELLEELEALSQALTENPDFVKLLRSPALRKDERLAVLDRSFEGKIQPYILNFMKILTENGTIGEFSGCVKEFRSRYNKDHNIEEVTAVTAVALSPELSDKLRAKLDGLTGKTILLRQKVDPSILGGVRLEMEGAQYEGSVKHQLDTLRRRLSETVI